MLDYLKTERIPVVTKDVLDIYPRKVCFLPASGKAMVKRLASANTEALVGAGTRRRAEAPCRPPAAAARSTCSERRAAAGIVMAKTRVVVVDDSALVRSLLAEIINRQPDMECVGAASDPLVAREMIRNLNPDVITLDVEMPRMDGIDFLARLMRLRPMPVVMVSTLTERGADVTLRALELGAVDFVAKPKIGVADGLRQLADDITEKIRIASQAHACAACRPRRGAATTSPAPPTAAGTPRAERRSAACRPRRSSSSAPPPAAPRPPRKC